VAGGRRLAAAAPDHRADAGDLRLGRGAGGAEHLPEAARSQGDYLLGEIFFSLAQDCAWQRTWTAALIEMAVADQPQNREVLRRWTAAWMPAAREAAAALSSEIGEAAGAAAERRAAAFRESLDLPDQPPASEEASDP
jgi:hypothetical protein